MSISDPSVNVPAPCASARLLIHAAPCGGGTDGDVLDGGLLAALLVRLRALAPEVLPSRPGAGHAGLRIEDLQGRQFFVCEDAQALIDVPLPAGTYNVSTLPQGGGLQRRYTVTLEQGMTFNLHVRLTPRRG